MSDAILGLWVFSFDTYMTGIMYLLDSIGLDLGSEPASSYSYVY